MAPPSAGQATRHSARNPKPAPRMSKRKRIVEGYAKLQKSVQDLDAKNAKFRSFSDLPLSDVTAQGLDISHYKSLTDIQSKAIPLGLQGCDILGAAKTGSGKTLAFLVPVLENLYRQRWTDVDGLGALIISPTRELAVQNFEVLRKIGRYHTFSAGLVIGGKSLKEERERLRRMNILVCTPGRLLQHMDQTAAFEVDNLQILVLDEADRIMDMGFQSSVDAIIKHLPRMRQTLLFSATQAKKVSDLARLSLRDAEYVSVHETSSSATPSTLKQHYVITRLPEKLDTLFGFIRANLKAKVLVFLSSGKQVRFVYESFRHLQPGIPLLHLHGRQKQTTRLEITTNFSASKNSCLFATDVVARGLDFPAVDWVIQLDCPEDADTYIHRVGRTARYERDGRAVLFLDPSEEGMLKRLEHKKVPIEKINVRQKKQQNIQHHLQNMCFKDPELKYLGQKAFISYTRSIYVQKDKEIFDISKIDLEGFATSLGLPGAPKVTFQKGDDAKMVKNAPRAKILFSNEVSDPDDLKKIKVSNDEVRTKYDRMFERRNQDVLSGHYARLIAEENHTTDEAAKVDTDEDCEFLSVKRVLSLGNEDFKDAEPKDTKTHSVKVVGDVGQEPIISNSKRQEKLLKSKKKLLKLQGRGKKLVFDDEGDAHDMYELKDEQDFHRRGTAEFQRAVFVQEQARRLRGADMDDKQLVVERKREKKREKKRKARNDVDEDGNGVDNPASFSDEDAEDPLALLASLPIQVNSAHGSRKRPKRFLEDESTEVQLDSGRRGDYVELPESLEDLEAVATVILG